VRFELEIEIEVGRSRNRLECPSNSSMLFKYLHNIGSRRSQEILVRAFPKQRTPRQRRTVAKVKIHDVALVYTGQILTPCLSLEAWHSYPSVAASVASAWQ
jgi:hypothetical protein